MKNVFLANIHLQYVHPAQTQVEIYLIIVTVIKDFLNLPRKFVCVKT
jgi:hypothetical protein